MSGWAMASIGVIVGGAGLLIFIGLLERRHERCPACGARALRCEQAVQTMALFTMEDGGRREERSWGGYYRCESCSTLWKKERGQWSAVSDDEWQQKFAQENNPHAGKP